MTISRRTYLTRRQLELFNRLHDAIEAVSDSTYGAQRLGEITNAMDTKLSIALREAARAFTLSMGLQNDLRAFEEKLNRAEAAIERMDQRVTLILALLQERQRD